MTVAKTTVRMIAIRFPLSSDWVVGRVMLPDMIRDLSVGGTRCLGVVDVEELVYVNM